MKQYTEDFVSASASLCMMYNVHTNLPVELEESTLLPKGFYQQGWKEANAP